MYKSLGILALLCVLAGWFCNTPTNVTISVVAILALLFACVYVKSSDLELEAIAWVLSGMLLVIGLVAQWVLHISFMGWWGKLIPRGILRRRPAKQKKGSQRRSLF